MALPDDVDVVVVRGYWLDETTGLGVRAANGHALKITFEPVALAGRPGGAPNLRDISSSGYIKLRQRTATVNPVTGYFATLLVASNDPDLDPYGGRRVTFPGETPFLIEVPYNAPVVAVDAAMSAATGLALNSPVRAVWLTDATLLENPLPGAPSGYLTSAQVFSAIGAGVASGVAAHDADTSAHPDIRDEIEDIRSDVQDVETLVLTTPRAYHHEQIAALATWTVVHGLGYRPAGIIARELGGPIIEPDDIAFPDLDTCILSWLVPVAGSADMS